MKIYLIILAASIAALIYFQFLEIDHLQSKIDDMAMQSIIDKAEHKTNMFEASIHTPKKGTNHVETNLSIGKHSIVF